MNVPLQTPPPPQAVRDALFDQEIGICYLGQTPSPPSDFRDALSEILKRQNKWKFSLLGVNEGIWSTRGGAGLSTVGGVGTNDSIWRCLKTLRRVGQVSMGGQVLDKLGEEVPCYLPIVGYLAIHKKDKKKILGIGIL